VKRFSYPIKLGLFIAIFLGILTVINLFSQRYHLRFDLTIHKLYSLCSQSIKVLKNLEMPIEVIGFFTNDYQKEQAKRLLEQYSYHNRGVNYSFIDPNRHPLEAKKYNVVHVPTLIIESGDRREQIYEVSEEKITNAIVRVSRKEKKIIYFLKGHGEHEINDYKKDGYSNLKKSLTDKGYIGRSLLLAKKTKVPEDASLLIIAGPKRPLLPIEIKAIETYLDKGGKVLFLLEPQTGEELADFLKNKAIVLGNDVIVDRISRLFGADYLVPVILKYNQTHPITKDFDLMCFLPLARSINIKKDLEQNIKAEILAWTSENSWAEKDLEELNAGKTSYDPNDMEGPVPVASASWSEEEGGFKLVVVGDADFINNTYLNLSGNKDLVLNMINWLTEERDLMAIPPKKIEKIPFILSRTKAKVIFWVPMIVLPLLPLLGGVICFLIRRKL
jgi:ABC-type uncharacterized transport system involved in gliding motility auxiliary subunit